MYVAVLHVVIAWQATHADALKVTKKAERMMDEGHFSSEQVRAQAELITTRWQELMLRTEERMKLVVAAHHWFKTAEQVRDAHVILLQQ